MHAFMLICEEREVFAVLRLLHLIVLFSSNIGGGFFRKASDVSLRRWSPSGPLQKCAAQAPPPFCQTRHVDVRLNWSAITETNPDRSTVIFFSIRDFLGA